ncbi:MAG: dockerin type I domain-containing protein [Defluviitaleaceae bacterium]|nr:dockerin type I domain-containing protein [Defluviitaleaceae bacterium]
MSKTLRQAVKLAAYLLVFVMAASVAAFSPLTVKVSAAAIDTTCVSGDVYKDWGENVPTDIPDTIGAYIWPATISAADFAPGSGYPAAADGPFATASVDVTVMDLQSKAIMSTVNAIGTLSDAAPAINAAIQAAGDYSDAHGGQYVVVQLSAGTFRTLSQISLDRSHVILRGAGMGSTRIVGWNPTPSVAYSGHLAVSIADSSGIGYPQMPMPRSTPRDVVQPLKIGDTSVFLSPADAANYKAGDILRLDRLADPNDGVVLAEPMSQYSSNFWNSKDNSMGWNFAYNPSNPNGGGYMGTAGTEWRGDANSIMRVPDASGGNAQGPGSPDGYRPVTQIIQIASVNTVTGELKLANEINYDYELAQHPQVWDCCASDYQYIGLEDMTVTTAYQHTAAQWSGCYWMGAVKVGMMSSFSWVKNVEVDGTFIQSDAQARYVGTAIDTYGYKDIVEGCYVHDSGCCQPSSAAYGISVKGTDCLFTNNIVATENKPIVCDVSGGGNVISYNYIPYTQSDDVPQWMETAIDMCHGSLSHSDLVEGNMAANAGPDSTHGNSAGGTIFRNWLTGENQDDRGGHKTGSIAGIGIGGDSFNYSSIGNILGKPGGVLSSAGPVSSARVWGFGNTAAGLAINGNDTANTTASDVNTPSAYKIGYYPFAQLPDPSYASFTWDQDYNYFTNSKLSKPGAYSGTLPDSLYLQSAPDFFSGYNWPFVDPDDPSATTSDPAGKLPAYDRYQQILANLPSLDDNVPVETVLYEASGVQKPTDDNNFILMRSNDSAAQGDQVATYNGSGLDSMFTNYDSMEIDYTSGSAPWLVVMNMGWNTIGNYSDDPGGYVVPSTDSGGAAIYSMSDFLNVLNGATGSEIIRLSWAQWPIGCVTSKIVLHGPGGDVTLFDHTPKTRNSAGNSTIIRSNATASVGDQIATYDGTGLQNMFAKYDKLSITYTGASPALAVTDAGGSVINSAGGISPVTDDGGVAVYDLKAVTGLLGAGIANSEIVRLASSMSGDCTISKVSLIANNGGSLSDFYFSWPDRIASGGTYPGDPNSDPNSTQVYWGVGPQIGNNSATYDYISLLGSTLAANKYLVMQLSQPLTEDEMGGYNVQVFAQDGSWAKIPNNPDGSGLELIPSTGTNGQTTVVLDISAISKSGFNNGLFAIQFGEGWNGSAVASDPLHNPGVLPVVSLYLTNNPPAPKKIGCCAECTCGGDGECAMIDGMSLPLWSGSKDLVVPDPGNWWWPQQFIIRDDAGANASNASTTDMHFDMQGSFTDGAALQVTYTGDTPILTWYESTGNLDANGVVAPTVVSDGVVDFTYDDAMAACSDGAFSASTVFTLTTSGATNITSIDLTGFSYNPSLPDVQLGTNAGAGGLSTWGPSWSVTSNFDTGTFLQYQYVVVEFMRPMNQPGDNVCLCAVADGGGWTASSVGQYLLTSSGYGPGWTGGGQFYYLPLRYLTTGGVNVFDSVTGTSDPITIGLFGWDGNGSSVVYKAYLTNTQPNVGLYQDLSECTCTCHCGECTCGCAGCALLPDVADASLAKVDVIDFVADASAGTGSSAADAITGSVTLPVGITSLPADEIYASNRSATVEAFSDDTYTASAAAYDLTGGPVHAYVKITSEDGSTTLYYDVTVSAGVVVPMYTTYIYDGAALGATTATNPWTGGSSGNTWYFHIYAGTESSDCTDITTLTDTNTQPSYDASMYVSGSYFTVKYTGNAPQMAVNWGTLINPDPSSTPGTAIYTYDQIAAAAGSDIAPDLCLADTWADGMADSAATQISLTSPAAPTPSSDAGLAKVGGVKFTADAATGTGASETDAITGSVTLPAGTASLDAAQILPSNGSATVEAFSDAGFVNAAASYDLTGADVTPVHAYVKVTAQDAATVKYYDVSISVAPIVHLATSYIYDGSPIAASTSTNPWTGGSTGNTWFFHIYPGVMSSDCTDITTLTDPTTQPTYDETMFVSGSYFTVTYTGNIPQMAVNWGTVISPDPSSEPGTAIFTYDEIIAAAGGNLPPQLCLVDPCAPDWPPSCAVTQISLTNPGWSDVTLAGMDIAAQPTLAYTELDQLDLSGLSVLLTYSDDSSETVAYADFAAKGITVAYSDGNPAQSGDIMKVAVHNGLTIVITYDGLTAETGALSVTVNAAYDVNGDGKVDSADLLLIMANLNKKASTNAVTKKCDVNNSGMVDMADYNLVAAYIAAVAA